MTSIFKLSFKIIGQIIFVIIFFSTLQAKNLDKFDKANRISDYLTGILLLNDNRYDESYKFLKKLNGLESSYTNYSVKYLYSLINSGSFNEAVNFSKKIEKKGLDVFESDLIIGVFYLKNSNLNLAKKYFLKAKKRNSRFLLNDYVSDSLYNWSNFKNLDLSKGKIELNKLDERFDNLNKIQNVFLNCFFNSQDTNSFFNQLTSNIKTDFSRYHYFYASYTASSGKIIEAKNIVQSALNSNPRNLLLNQYRIDLEEGKNINSFNCNNEQHVIAEILYIAANALSYSQYILYQIFI